LVKIAQKAIPNSTLSVAMGAADLGFFTAKNIKSIVVGPGQKDQQHVVDEYCHPDQIPQAVELYEKIVQNWSKT
jgi:acetylornithine deacetylase/succinyl-diaminopimelate desuccinylase-like protein